nr:MAG: hypothetical protein [Polycipiviridae sp.]
MYGIQFQRASEPDVPISNGISWSTNPTYQSPESTSTSWYDQTTHWDSNSEGIENLPSTSSLDSEPYYLNRSTFDGYSWNQGANQYLQPQTAWPDRQGFGANLSEAQAEVAAPAAGDLSGLPTELSEGVEATLEFVETGAEAVETGAEVAEGFSGYGIAAIINQQLGQATANAMNASMKEGIASDFAHNTIQQGMGAQLQSNIIEKNENANVENISSIAGIGSILGPAGAAAGNAIGSAIFTPQSAYMNTANSFNGMVNPQDTGIVQSLNTSDATGQTQMIDNE